MYEIVRYCPALKTQIAQLQQHLWRGNPCVNTAYLEWKYEQNPYLPEPIVYVAVSGGRVVGMRGMFGSRWEAGSRSATFVIPSADDLVIAPGSRNRGLLAQIMRAPFEELASKGHEYAFSLSSSPLTLMASVASGWQGIGSLGPAHRRTPGGLVRWLEGKVGRLPVLWRYAGAVGRLERGRGCHAFMDLDCASRSRRTATPGGVRVERVPPVDAMAGLVARLGHDGRIRHVRDAAYLGWRLRNPLHEYRVLVWEERRMEGYLVLQADRVVPERGVNIVDWEASRPEIRAELLRAAVDWGRFPELSTWTGALPGDCPALLAAAGFIPVGSGSQVQHTPTVLIHPLRRREGTAELTLGGRQLLDGGNWDMRMIYSMAG